MVIANQKIPIWDTILHVSSGFIFFIVGILIIRKLIYKQKLSPFFITLFAFCFSMTCALLWEVLEFSFERFTYCDTQKDRIITSFNSDYLKTNKNKTKIIKNIDHKILYDKNNKKIIRINKGYLDIGLIDTMKDIIVYLIATSISSVMYFIYLRRKYN